MKKEKTYWYDLKPSDDNKGFIYGINYIDNDEVIECEWFKTRQAPDIDEDIWRKPTIEEMMSGLDNVSRPGSWRL